MKFRPLHDRVVVKRVDSETKTSGGIIIPDTAAEKPQQGEVVAVGPGSRDESGKLIEIDLKKDDKVLFGKWSGTEVKIEGQDLLIMKESDLLGVVEKTGSLKKARTLRPRRTSSAPDTGLVRITRGWTVSTATVFAADTAETLPNESVAVAV